MANRLCSSLAVASRVATAVTGPPIGSGKLER